MTRRSKPSSRRATRRDWICLPSDLLELIARKLTNNILDYIRFCGVCTTWRRCAAAVANTEHQWLPWLILPHGQDGHTIPFFNPADRRFYELPLPNKARDKFVRGSSCGWLVMLGVEDKSVSLLNPITQAHIILPPWPPYWGLMDEIILCCNPTAPPPNQPRQLLLAVSDARGKLLIYRHGDERWDVIATPPEFSRCLDIAYLKEEAALYVVSLDGRVAVLDLASSTLRPLTNLTPCPEIGCLPRVNRRLVVTAAGELLLVAWDLLVLPRPQFHVFKLDMSTKEGHLNWVRAADIGGSMLFYSNEEVIEVCNPKSIGSRPNKIYRVDGNYLQHPKYYMVCVRARVWDIVTSRDKSSSPAWVVKRPQSTLIKTSKKLTKQRGRMATGFTWMTPSLS